MLVYSTTLWLKNDVNIDTILEIIAKWLSRKTHENITTISLKANNIRRMNDNSRIQTIRSDSAFPTLHAIRFTHSDREVSGRQWVAEIGIRQLDIISEIECSILLRTDEVSPRVDAKIQPTLPYVVHDFIKYCSPSSKTVGLKTTILNHEDEIEGLDYLIKYNERQFPFVLISPTPDNQYLVNVENLRFHLEGIAEIYQIPIGADTFFIGRIIGNQYVAWDGAINIIFPQVQRQGKTFAPTKRLTQEELRDIITQGIEPEREILSIITHRTNLPNSWRHISPETVSELIRKKEVTSLKKQAAETGQSAEYIKLLEDELDQKNNETQQKIVQLQSEINYLEGTLIQMDDEKRQIRFENESLKSQLSHIADRTTEGSENRIPDHIRETIFIASKALTPEESMSIITKLFPNRIEVLESAWKSADESKMFKENKKVFDLLWKLATEYWLALVNGKSDAEARSVFGNSYSAKESESVENNKRARQLRTFQYKGQEIKMMKHLKIGNKRSLSETIRIHFEWNSSNKKIIIGHCGPHLDHK